MRTGLAIFLFCMIFFFILQAAVMHIIVKYMHVHLTYEPRGDLVNGKQIHVYPHTGTYHKNPYFIKYERPNAFRFPDLDKERERKLDEFEKQLHTGTYK